MFAYIPNELVFEGISCNLVVVIFQVFLLKKY